MNVFKMAFSLVALGAVIGSAFADNGAVYVQTNAASNNQVLVYTHGIDGKLAFSASYPTEGAGTGAGLGSQGAVTLSTGGDFLYAVDAGSNDVAVFKVQGHRLRHVGNFASGGTMPISVTENHRLVYVLNAGDTGNISGFRANWEGNLLPVSLSSRPLSSSAAGPAQIQFNPGGDALVVTEKATNTIDTWPMFGDRPGFLYTDASNGATPFGFDFDNRGRLFVSEAAGGAANASSASSYALGQGGWNSITTSAATNQTAACWLAVSPSGKYAYTANAGSGTISGFSISQHGDLSLLTPSGLNASTGAGSHPVDMGFSDGGQYLYVLANGNGTIAEYRVKPDGSLTSIGTVTGVPTAAQGLASK